MKRQQEKATRPAHTPSHTRPNKLAWHRRNTHGTP